MSARQLIDMQVRWSKAFDALLPEHYRVDGNRFFIDEFAPRYLTPGLRVFDVGSGRSPYLSKERKDALRLHVTGLDISRSELDAAPAGAYDQTIESDITLYHGRRDADLVICQALLEHVTDVGLAMAGIASILRPDGIALIFVPSRNAAFARLNLLLPQRLKRWLLFSIFPQTRNTQGFASYYDRCTPRALAALVSQCGFSIAEERHFWASAYFSFCLPVHIAWRGWLAAFRCVAGPQSAESFCMALKKTSEPIRNDR